MKSVSLAEMACATFVELLHSRFRIHGSGPPIELELQEATPHQAGSFSLIFAGPLTHFLPQRTYRFEHEPLSFDLFIVPIGQDQNGFQYEAIVNRAVQR